MIVASDIILMKGPCGMFNSVVAAAALNLMLMYMGMSTQTYQWCQNRGARGATGPPNICQIS
jgi:hypothetical protein